jgi:hypothetical protein
VRGIYCSRRCQSDDLVFSNAKTQMGPCISGIFRFQNRPWINGWTEYLLFLFLVLVGTVNMTVNSCRLQKMANLGTMNKKNVLDTNLYLPIIFLSGTNSVKCVTFILLA